MEQIAKPKLNIKEDCFLVCNSDGNPSFSLFFYQKRWKDSMKTEYLPKDMKYVNCINTIVPSPTNNCQISSLASANLALMYDNPIELITLLWLRTMKRILLIDVHQQYEKQFEELFGTENILTKNKYTSTNNSQMMIYLFKTDNLNKYYKEMYEKDNKYWTCNCINYKQFSEEQNKK